MKRKLLILIGSFVMILAAFGVYYLVAGSGAWITAEKPHRGRGQRPDDRRPGSPGRMAIERGEGLNVEVRDEQGRLEAVYKAPKWTKREDDSYILYEPMIRLYRSDGQRAFISGDHAVIYAEEVAGGINVRRGNLSGNVRVVIDRIAGADRPDLAKVGGRLEGLIKIFAEDLNFDNNALELRTQGNITLLAPEVDIIGEGLEILWNDAPRELRLLKIRQGRYMAVYNVPEELKMISLPGGEGGRAEEGGAAETLPGSGEGATEEIADASDAGQEPDAGVAPATQPDTLPATEPAAKPQQRPARNIYLAEFSAEKGAIHVDSGPRKMRGAEKLTLQFRWDTTRQRLMEGETATGPQTRPASTAPGEAATRPATQPFGEVARPRATATRPAGKTQPMIITWRGPLVISPEGYAPGPPKNTYELTASGSHLALSEPQGRAYCSKLNFRYPQRRGELTGSEDSPVRLEMAGGDYAVCKSVSFTPGTDQAILNGPGYMQRAAGGGEQEGGDVGEISLDTPRGERIEWSESVTVNFARQGQTDDEGPDMYAEEAVFVGDVRLKRPAAGEFVRCPKLRVQMRPLGGEVQPTEALATGDVTAHQAGRDIEAETLSIFFGRVDESSSVRPMRLVGTGGVKITDTSDPKQKVVATSQRLTSNLAEESAVLIGGRGRENRWAKITQGGNFLAGEEIRLARRTESATVTGAGEIEYLTERDMSGRELSEPRPVKITFDGGMDYRGRRNTAEFRENVHLVSRGDSMNCDRLSLLFRKTQQAEEKPDAQSSAASGQEGVGFGVERMGRRKVSMIMADGDVEFASRREDPDTSKLLTRLKLDADQAMFDARPDEKGEESHEMHVIGEGTLVLEDYRPPEKQTDEQRDSSAVIPRGQKPLQAVFNWKKFMTLHQESREVRMKGDVKVVYRSAKQVVGTDNLNVPDWGELPTGRRTVLLCDNLTASFTPPEKPAAAGAVADATGPAVGELKKFTAMQEVNLNEGPWQFLGDVMIYNRHEDRTKDKVILRGHMAGEPTTDAHLFYEDDKTGQSQKWSSPQILFFPATQRVETGKVTGGGVQ